MLSRQCTQEDDLNLLRLPQPLVRAVSFMLTLSSCLLAGSCADKPTQPQPPEKRTLEVNRAISAQSPILVIDPNGSLDPSRSTTVSVEVVAKYIGDSAQSPGAYFWYVNFPNGDTNRVPIRFPGQLDCPVTASSAGSQTIDIGSCRIDPLAQDSYQLMIARSDNVDPQVPGCLNNTNHSQTDSLIIERCIFSYSTK